MAFPKLYRHDGEPCWLGLRRSFWLQEAIAIVCGLCLFAIYAWLVWGWAEADRALEACRATCAAEED